MTPIEFGGRVIIIGSGSIGQGILPVIRGHFKIEGEGRLLVLSADEQGRGLARQHGARTSWKAGAGRCSHRAAD